MIYYRYYFILEQKEDSHQKVSVAIKQDIQRDFPELFPELYNFICRKRNDYIWNAFCLHLVWHKKCFNKYATINEKNYEENCYLGNFVFLFPSPSEHCWETTSKTKLYRVREGFLNIIFKILIIFCHWLSAIYKKKRKYEILFML